ncbi:MAG: D-alanyl-D-alanine carboxypeptidase family protein [Eubacteriales bacterium]|nr:D-alanyl-D-alanine carboxypeptidase family protein [Eubacteriales bacterium]
MNSKKNVRKVLILLVIAILLTSINGFAIMDVSSDIRAAVVGDAATGEVFYQFNGDETVEIASVTKIMTYLLAREAIAEGRASFDDVVKVTRNAATTEGSALGLTEGDEYVLETLMNAIMIASGNDAAVAIAEHIAGTEAAFIQAMHDKATQLGITTAHFINPSGMPLDDEETDQNFMSANDLFKLSAYLLNKYPDVTDITIQKEFTMPERNFKRFATNPLLNEMEGVDGLKTGYTDKAGLCLVSTIPYRDQEDSMKDRRVIAVLMGAQSHDDRIAKSKELLEYGYYNYFIEKVVNAEELVDEILISNALEVNVPVIAGEDYYKLLKNGTTLRTVIEYQQKIRAPLEKGAVVGKMNVYLNNEIIKEIPVQVSEDIKKAGFLTIVFRYLANLLGI